MEAHKWLDTLIFEEEIKQVMFEVNSNKSLGPDNFTAKFYQECWPIIKIDLVRVVKDFFHKGKMLREVNNTFIVMIPKSENASSLDQFRQNSLGNFMYKIITKIVANWLQQVIP